MTIPSSAIVGRPINPPLFACAVGEGEADPLAPTRGTFVPLAFIVDVDVGLDMELDMGEGLLAMDEDVIVVIVVAVPFITMHS